MNIGQYIDLSFVLPNRAFESSFELKLFGLFCPLVVYCTSTVYFPLTDVIKQCWGREMNTFYGPVPLLFGEVATLCCG
jgi:hypothetical protein